MRPLLRLAGALPLLALSIVSSAQMMGGDRREADPRVQRAGTESNGLPIKNDPPSLLFSEQAAILVLIDGDPVYRPIDRTDLQRIINTKPFIVRDTAGVHYMKVFDGWMEAYELTGNWSVSGVAPHGVEQALRQAVAQKTVDLLDGANPGRPDETPRLEAGAPPAIVISREPADDELYVLTAGRWFRAWTTDGPWEFVPSRELPADIVDIPDSSPKATVKASLAGTTQSLEARRENDVVRSAKITRRQTRLEPPVIDGDPKLQPIDGTSLSYVVNSPMPIIAPNPPTEYYAVQDGVWFVETSPSGPWNVASSVPPAVYTIPPSSPLHHVTYVRIYNATADDVSVGYTADYLGAVVGDGVVVLAWGWRGERYPWVWRGTQPVRVPSDGPDGRGAGAWRDAAASNIYERWRSGS